MHIGSYPQTVLAANDLTEVNGALWTGGSASAWANVNLFFWPRVSPGEPQTF